VTTTTYESRINRVPLSELESKATYIVLAQVTQVVEGSIKDHVTIKVGSNLKGQSNQDTYTIDLVMRGGLMAFDPSVKKGDTGVFFLNQDNLEGQVETAYSGSIAIFPKNNFELAE
jgi:hypothetical protein